MSRFFYSSRLAIMSGLFMMFMIAAPAASWPFQDVSGTKTGTAADVPAAKPGSPTVGELADAVGPSRIAVNIVWTLVTCFLMMFMQAGFAMVETGFTRAKNVAHSLRPADWNSRC